MSLEVEKEKRSPNTRIRTRDRPISAYVYSRTLYQLSYIRIHTNTPGSHGFNSGPVHQLDTDHSAQATKAYQPVKQCLSVSENHNWLRKKFVKFIFMKIWSAAQNCLHC